jgi:cytochrome c550
VCARCHGADLQGGVGPALGLDAPSIDKPIDYFVLTITRGQGRMPSFSGTLTADQIERVAGYIMEQQGR